MLLDNSMLGKITKEQRAAQFDVCQTSLHNPDFAEYARISGALGIRVERADQLGAALADDLVHPGPALVDVLADGELI